MIESTKNYEILKEIFNQIDIIGVAKEIDDEYGPEIIPILKGLPKCQTKTELKILVFRTIEKILGVDAAINKENYLNVANHITARKDELDFPIRLRY